MDLKSGKIQVTQRIKTNNNERFFIEHVFTNYFKTYCGRSFYIFITKPKSGAKHRGSDHKKHGVIGKGKNGKSDSHHKYEKKSHGGKQRDKKRDKKSHKPSGSSKKSFREGRGQDHH